MLHSFLLPSSYLEVLWASSTKQSYGFTFIQASNNQIAKQKHVLVLSSRFLPSYMSLFPDSEMNPPITDSVARVHPRRWALGSSMICEMSTTSAFKPADAVVDWQDGEKTFYLRRATANDLSQGDPEIGRVHVGGTSAAVWALGDNAFCKVHAWCEGLELEANTIRFVQETAPEVPVPEVLYSWVDRDMSRAFLITRKVRGKTLEQIWPWLSTPQRMRIADSVAGYCEVLAASTSSRFETVSGCGVYETRFMESPPSSHPTWLPIVLGPFSLESFRAHMTDVSTESPPETDGTFVFYHEDLGPTNVMIQEDGNDIAAIIDWELAAYCPRFWVAIEPAYAGSFWLECETDEPKLWGQLLAQALVKRGYERMDQASRRWSEAVK